MIARIKRRWRRLRAWLAIAAVSLAGCGIPYMHRPSQVRATDLVWCGVYQEHDNSAPPINWIAPPSLDCANGTGWQIEYDGVPTCVAGLFESDEYLALVALPDDSYTFSALAFAHELGHAHWLNKTGQPDKDHTGPVFAHGGLLDQANAALRAEGL